MHRLFEFETIDSTNTYLKDNYLSHQEGDVILTNHQTAGKGRMGRKWEDDSSSLLFSLLLKERLDEKMVSLLPLLSGVSLSLTLDDLGISSLIKWPNDVLINSKKCAGILLEAVSEINIKAVIIGIGVNLNQTSFDPPLDEKAISLRQVIKKTLDKKEVLNLFLKHFDELYEDYLKGNNEFIKILKSRSYLDGKEVYLNYYGEKKHGFVTSINDDGRLEVKVNDKSLLLNAGEVTLESIYKAVNK